MTNNNYPFAQELITDTQGNIRKVILSFEDYQNLLENLEDVVKTTFESGTIEEAAGEFEQEHGIKL